MKGEKKKEGGGALPVWVWKQFILNVSASIVSTPELPGTGLIRVAIAWIEWNVEARMR